LGTRAVKVLIVLMHLRTALIILMHQLTRQSVNCFNASTHCVNYFNAPINALLMHPRLSKERVGRKLPRARDV